MWRVIDERVIYDVPTWITIRGQDVALPGGEMIHDYVLLDERDGCLVLAVTPDDEVILLEQYRHGRGAREVGLPAGYLDPGEDPLATARRELLEETGYAGDDWTSLGALFTNSNRGRQTFYFFLARDVTRILPVSREAGEEDMTVSFMPLRALEEYAARSNGDIGMAATTGILLGMAALKNEG